MRGARFRRCLAAKGMAEKKPEKGLDIKASTG